MPSNQDRREQIETRKSQIAAHALKIQQEAQLAQPQYGLILYWTKEVENEVVRIEHLMRRLPEYRGQRRRR